MSLVVHLGVLIMLACLTSVTVDTSDLGPLTSVFEEFNPDDYSFDTVAVESFGNQSDLNTPSPSQAAATTLSHTPQQESQERLEEKLLKVDQSPTP